MKKKQFDILHKASRMAAINKISHRKVTPSATMAPNRKRQSKRVEPYTKRPVIPDMNKTIQKFFEYTNARKMELMMEITDGTMYTSDAKKATSTKRLKNEIGELLRFVKTSRVAMSMMLASADSALRELQNMKVEVDAFFSGANVAIEDGNESSVQSVMPQAAEPPMMSDMLRRMKDQMEDIVRVMDEHHVSMADAASNLAKRPRLNDEWAARASASGHTLSTKTHNNEASTDGVVTRYNSIVVGAPHTTVESQSPQSVSGSQAQSSSFFGARNYTLNNNMPQGSNASWPTAASQRENARVQMLLAKEAAKNQRDAVQRAILLQNKPHSDVQFIPVPRVASRPKSVTHIMYEPVYHAAAPMRTADPGGSSKESDGIADDSTEQGGHM